MDEDAEAAGGRPFGMRALTYAQAALRLLDNGYEPLPIRRGKKSPILPRWSGVRIDEAAVRAWTLLHPHLGVGLRTGSLVGVDIDVEDPDLAHAAAELVKARLGSTLLRVGRWPKRVLIYRTEQPFAKLAIHKCEVLGLGQQMVAFGMHPDTGRPYYWPEESPLDVPLCELPPVDHAACLDLLGELAQVLPQGPEPPGGRRRKRADAHAACIVVARDENGLVADGRDGWMSRIAYHSVHDALEREAELDARALTEEVWARFASTANLTRPKQDGSDAYAPSDAGRKVADKLRLLRQGRLPPRAAEPLEEPAGVGQLDVREARLRLDAALGAACDRILAWHRGGASEEAPQIGLRATVGLGKSASARRHLVALRRRLLEAGAPSRVVICTPSHALAEETAAEWRTDGAVAAVLRGYEARHPVLRRPMCRDLEAVRAAVAVGEPVQTSVCADGKGRTCAHFTGCPKQVNRRAVDAADIVIAPYDALFTGFPISPADIALILIDEGCWSRAADERSDLCVETFQHDLLIHDPARGKQDAVGKTADLHELRRAAAAAFADNGVGLVSAERLRAAGLSRGDIDTAIGLEQRRLRDPGLYPGMAQREREQALLRAAINARTRAYVAAWRAVGRLLTAGADVDGRLEIGSPAPETGAHPIKVRGVKSLHANLRGRPVVHLDATLRPELARTILPRLQVTEIESAAPWMELRLVTGSFGKRALCAGGRADEQELARRAHRLEDCVHYVRWHARRLAPGRVLVVTYKDCEAAFASIAGVEVAHFNAIAGLDVYRDVRLLVVIGRPLPPEREVRRLCGALFGHAPSSGYRAIRKGVRTSGGDVRAVRVTRHEDDKAELLRAAICDDEVVQAIGRGRGVNRTADDPLEVHVLADVALPLVHDRLLDWSTEAPDLMQRMLLAGLAVDSPSDAARLHPDLFENAEAAKKAFQRGAFKGHFPHSNTLREMSLKSAAYRRPGRGCSWQRAWWIDGSTNTALKTLTAALGPIAGWTPTIG